MYTAGDNSLPLPNCVYVSSYGHRITVHDIIKLFLLVRCIWKMQGICKCYSNCQCNITTEGPSCTVCCAFTRLQ